MVRSCTIIWHRAFKLFSNHVHRDRHSMIAARRRPTRGPNDRSDTIYRALRQAIIEQALEPGAKLPEDAIGERFGVSRTIVRHALGRLASEGLAELKLNRGAFVASPSLEEARDVYELRILVERLVVERLAGALTKADLGRLLKHVQAEEEARGTAEPRSIRLATEFHIVLADITGSTTLSHYVSQLASRCGLILALHGRPHSSDCAVSEHREVIAALVEGDRAMAASVMEKHLRSVMGRALIGGARKTSHDIRAILAPYAEEFERQREDPKSGQQDARQNRSADAASDRRDRANTKA
jgi:DNA-binding GntR family transcriptional regulator